MALRRLRKGKKLGSLLDQAATLLGHGWQVDLSETTVVDTPHQRAIPLCRAGERLGTLVVTAPSGPPPDWNTARLPELTRFIVSCLEALLDDEAAMRSLGYEALSKYREISLFHRATLALNDSLRPRDVAHAVLGECQHSALPADTGLVFLRSSEKEEFTPGCVFGDGTGQRLAAVAHSELFRTVVRSQKGEIVNDLAGDPRWHGEADLSALLLSPLLAADRCVGMLLLAGAPGQRFEASHLQYVGTLATVAGIAMGNALQFERVQTLINSLMQALATAIDARDPFTAGHSQRVARLGVALAKLVHQDSVFFPEITYSPSDLRELLYAGLLHDVGKIGIREEVLTKATRLPTGTMAVIGQRLALETVVTGQDNATDYEALVRINAANVLTPQDIERVAAIGARSIPIGPRHTALLTPEEIACLLIPRGNLTPEERREIERHPAESQRILRHIPFPEDMGRLLTIISQHHERLDGSGYPEGLTGEAILLQSRIIAIVDIYDAITMARHYKPALPRAKALEILWQEARSGRIDSRLVELLDTHIDVVERDCEQLAERIDLSDYLSQEKNTAMLPT